MKPIATTKSALRKLILAQQGLLRWSGGKGPFAQGVPWQEQYRGVAGTHEVLKKLEAVQLDPVAVIERNHHLVFLNRVGKYKPAYLEALYPAKQVFEYWAQARCILPIEDWSLFEWRRERWRLEHTIEGMMIHNRSEAYGREVLEAIEYIREKLTQEGSLPTRMLDTGKKVRGNWGFSAKASSQAMEHLWWAGEIVVSERKNEERHFALAGNWLPPSPPTPLWSGALPSEALPEVEGGSSLQAKLLKFIRAYGVFDAYGSGSRLGWREWAAGEKRAELERLLGQRQIVPLEIEGLASKRQYYLWAQLRPLLEGLKEAKAAPKVWFISPLDNLIWRRERIVDLFGFDYKWEIYVPGHKRKHGPYILPILEGEHFIGRLDARMDRAKGQLVVKQIFWESQADKSRVARVEKALEKFAASLGAALAWSG